jgi:phage terminase large subunit-like protein
VTASPAETLAALPEEARERELRSVGPDEAAHLLRSWGFWSRPEQRAPGWAWRWWVMVTGRGYGKNRSGSEWVTDRCEEFARHGWRHQVGLVNRTFGHVRALQIDGESGLSAVCERRGHRLYHPTTASEARLQVRNDLGRWHTSTIEIHTADDPDRARGRNLHTVHADEVAAWRPKRDAEGGTSFTNVDLALRALCPPGMQPQGMVTTTPRPIPLIRDLISSEYGPTAVTRGSMYDNRANLAASFLRAVERRYDGTRLGAQEIHGVVLDDVYGALWDYDLIDRGRAEPQPMHRRRVVGVDPPGGLVTECGIVVCGLHAHIPTDRLRHADVLADESLAGPPERWAKVVVDQYHRWGCEAVIAERNFGEEMVRSVIHNVDPNVNVRGVRASESKRARAEPITLMYDKGRIHHPPEPLAALEEELTTWVPPGTIDEYGVDRGSVESPNRLDAMVWALSDLLPQGELRAAVATSPNRRPTPAGRPAQVAWSPTFSR